MTAPSGPATHHGVLPVALRGEEDLAVQVDRADQRVQDAHARGPTYGDLVQAPQGGELRSRGRRFLTRAAMRHLVQMSSSWFAARK